MAETVEEFQDFTVATHWERFVASLEQIFRLWASTGRKERQSSRQESSGGPSQTRVVSHQLPFRSEPYTLSYFTDNHQTSTNQQQANLQAPDGPQHDPAGSSLARHYSEDHKLQQWFNTATYVTLEPNSYSRRILNDQEASTLLSALAAALSNCRLAWPAFLPVHDPLRDAHWGIGAAGLATIHYDSDSIHLSKNPTCLQQVEGQLQFFSQQLMPHSFAASQACLAAASPAHTSSSAHGSADAACRVTVSMLRSYELPRIVTEQEEEDEMLRNNDPSASWPEEWADTTPWRSFACHVDPVGSLELDMLWSGIPAEQAMQDEGFPLSTACSWRLHALAPASRAPSHTFYASKAKVKRDHLKIFASPSLLLSQNSAQLQHSLENSGSEPDTFTSMLTNLVHSRRTASTARAVGDLAGKDWWERQGLNPPAASPPDNLQMVLADVFQEDPPREEGVETAGNGVRSQKAPQDLPHLHFPKTAPADSLLVRLALHVMCFSNARAIAGLWQRFVRYLREGCWDQGRLLPRVTPARHHQSRQQDSAVPAVSAARAEADGNALPRPDFSCCVLHQKLQMLNLCIQQAHGLQPAAHAPGPSTSGDMQANASLEGWDSGDMEDFQEASSEVDGIPPALHLLADPAIPINIPETQEAPAMTEDMLLERQAALAALDESEVEQAARARLQGGGLLQADMAAFKAANPACQLADFVRWHSPKDWQPDPSHPQGGMLSDRMSHQGNVWRQLWQTTAGKAASAQEPLMNAEKEAERVFHDLEQVPPRALWDQLLALAAVAAAAMLAACDGAALLPARQQFLQFQQNSSGVLEEASSSWLKGEMTPRASGSPRGRPRGHPRGNLAASVTSEEEEEQEAAEEELREEQAATLVQSLQELEQVVVAGESLCRRLPGCPVAASKLLQAAMQPPDLPVSYSSADMSPAHQVNGDSDADEVSDTMLSPTPEGQQDESQAMQAGIQVTHAQEKLLVHALMSQQPTDPSQHSLISLEQCGDCSAWGDGLRTEWVTQCLCASNEQQISHRLYVQAAPGEMRLATVMVAEA
ncbi:hypothetical protein WJX82_002504 [Trebouxia sp. C0006]